jgi:tRNA threonylcarbamoyladenosine biosynthesis protein TsaE
MIDIIVKTPEECMDIGEKISPKLKPGDILSLEGELGAGKTTFVKGILKGLNYKYEVTSPTFTLINEYEADVKVIHIDFYRENDIKRWEVIGLNEYLYSDNIIILEWGNLVKDLLPDDIISIFFEHFELNKRRIFSNYELFSH